MSPETIIVDLDGTIIKHQGSIENQLTMPPEILPGVRERFALWEREGCRILILTGRRECFRTQTVAQLAQLQLPYDVLIMGVGGGPRVLINDMKPDGTVTARAHSVRRNTGFSTL